VQVAPASVARCDVHETNLTARDCALRRTPIDADTFMGAHDPGETTREFTSAARPARPVFG
jgi:hypothetical protein